MTVYRENDVVQLPGAINATVIGERRSIVIPANTVGTVVLVHGDPMQPAAYEVEFYIKHQDCYALATIEAERI